MPGHQRAAWSHDWSDAEAYQMIEQEISLKAFLTIPSLGKTYHLNDKIKEKLFFKSQFKF